MKAITHVFAIVVLFTAIFISCTKKSDDPLPTKTATTPTTATPSAAKDTISAYTWSLSDLTINPGYDTSFYGIKYTVTDIYPFLDDCQKDDTYNFNKDSSYVVSEGATTCDPTDAEKGIWYLSADAKVITTVVNKSTTTYTIKQMGNKKIVATSSTPYTFKGKNYEATLTFSHR